MRLFVRPVSPRCRISSAAGSAWRAAAEPAAHATTTNSPASSEIPNRQNVKAFKHKKYTKTKIGKTLDMHVRRRTRAVPDSIHNGSISPPSNHVPRKTGSRPSNSALGGRHAPLCVVFFCIFLLYAELERRRADWAHTKMAPVLTRRHNCVRLPPSKCLGCSMLIQATPNAQYVQQSHERPARGMRATKKK
jgi:hypothetical protein